MRQLLLLLCVNLLLVAVASAEKEDCTDLARDEETLLVFSTLGGGLTAIDPLTSEIRWTIDDEPAIKSTSQTDFPVPQYLPDPRDGSLYQLGDMGDLKKLPYTIPQLVANAPCRSSDGILYSGKKSDSWFLIDPKTGRREKLMGFENVDGHIKSHESIGWATSRSVYLGRTQYTVMMFDSLSKDKNTKPWNITFFDYSSHSMAPEISSDYEYLHLTASSSGLTATLDRKHGKFIWQKDLSSPVIAAFLLSKEGLLSVPFTTVSDETLRNVVEDAKDGNTNDIKLFQSLYIGEHPFGLYALPSLVDKNTATISSDPPVKLIEGPHKTLKPSDQNLVYLNDLLEKEKEKNRNIIVLGHYQMPKTNEDIKISLMPSSTRNVDNRELATITNMELLKATDFILVDGGKTNSIGVQTDESYSNSERPTNKSNDTHNEKIFLMRIYIKKIFTDSKAWLTDKQSGLLHQIVLVLIVTVLTMFWYMWSTVRELRHSQHGSQSMNRSSGSSNVNYQDLIDLGDGEVQVGKISFNCNELLGKGCEGTFVFKGTFEKRKVAVKRLLPECFTFADREVTLLRESDAHENVVRYFCTEQDRQFRYIAVELCAATLQDYTEGAIAEQLRQQINVREVLKQATSGLNHLHSLNIVHRDIKPQNVLLSLPDVNNSVRAMISDFGLCKKLNYGKTSFSRRSGITGTEGWIAPEMVKGQRTTTSVDIFSLGCVFYYVLTDGRHPFGDNLKRQANILSGEYDLDYLMADDVQSENVLAQELIADMINHDSLKRPPTRAVLQHPFFWNQKKILAFLQDVSDRVEKLTFSTDPLKTLEKNGREIVRRSWHLHLDTEITADLRKYRGYMEESVRDLLRAVRNKRHHYHELTEDVQKILGAIPHEFTNYWIQRFPHLLSHTYHSLSICSHENPFRSYYDPHYKFTRPEYFYRKTDDVEFVDSPKIIAKNAPPGANSGNASAGNSPAKKQQDNTPKDNKVQKQNRKGVYNFRRNQNDNFANFDPPNRMGMQPDDSGYGNFNRFRNRSSNFRPRPTQTIENFVWRIPKSDDAQN